MVGAIIGAHACAIVHACLWACCLTCVGPLFCGYEPSDVGFNPGYGFSATEYKLVPQQKHD